MVDKTASSAAENHTRYIAFRGSRVDALERLPSVCPRERLEFGNNRISLVSELKRVDLLILAEMDVSLTESVPSMMLVEVRFSAGYLSQIDAFIQSLQRVPASPLH